MTLFFNYFFLYSKWLQCFIWPIDGTLTDSTTRGLNGPGCIIGYEGALHISQNARTGASASDII